MSQRIRELAEECGFRTKDVHFAFLENHNEFIAFHDKSVERYREAIKNALSTLKNGNRTWECMDILEKVLK